MTAPRFHWLAAVALAAAAGIAVVHAQAPPAPPPARVQLSAKLRTTLDRLAAEATGVVGIGVVDLSSGERWGVNETLVFAQGSAIKIPLLIELFRRADAGELALTDRKTLTAADRTGGSSLLQYFADGGSAFSLHDLAVPMIVQSDNTATNMLIDAVGMDHVNRTMASLGFAQTKLRRKMIRPEASGRGDENVSTPREAVDLMVRLSRCDLPLTAASCAEVRRLLELPKGGEFRQPIPAGLRVAWKPGGLEGVSTAWGLVALPGAPYAVSIMVNYGNAQPGEVVRAVSAAVYQHFALLAGATPFGTRVDPALVRKPGSGA
ncbi:MAG: serine hydrolase [Vicinamibacterales bacterium]